MGDVKRYPFSVQKHAHSIELYHNFLQNLISDVESGAATMDSAAFDRLCDLANGPVQELYEAMFDSRDGRLVYLTGAQIGLAKRIVGWSSERRAASLIAAGKTEYLKYC